VHCSGYAFELHRADVPERDPLLLRGVGDRLADQHLAGPRVVSDACREVHGLAEVVALLEEDWPRVQADVGWRQPGGRQPVHHLQGGTTPAPGSPK